MFSDNNNKGWVATNKLIVGFTPTVDGIRNYYSSAKDKRMQEEREKVGGREREGERERERERERKRERKMDKLVRSGSKEVEQHEQKKKRLQWVLTRDHTRTNHITPNKSHDLNRPMRDERTINQPRGILKQSFHASGRYCIHWKQRKVGAKYQN